MITDDLDSFSSRKGQGIFFALLSRKFYNLGLSQILVRDRRAKTASSENGYYDFKNEHLVSCSLLM